MDSEITGVIGIAVLMLMLIIRVPIGIALISVSFVGLYYIVGERASVGILVSIPVDFIGKWTLSPVPMFLLMGFVCFHAGLTRGLFDAGRVLLSWLPGGLAIASIAGSAGFAAVSGSSVACSAAMGRIAIPEMLRLGYHPSLASGTLAAAGTLGALIPPSILLILFGIFAEVSIGRLFLASIGVGIATFAAYVVVVLVHAILFPAHAPRLKASEIEQLDRRTLKAVLPTIALIVVVLGGLFSGLFTATEAGAIGAAASLVIALVVGNFGWKKFSASIRETLATTAALFLIAIGANLLTRFLVLSGTTDLIGDVLLTIGSDTTSLILVMMLVYLLLGMFVEPIGAMLLTLPIFLPVLGEANINLIWFGVFVTKLLEIGMITPPIGLNVFIIKGVVGDQISLGQIFKGIGPFLIADAAVVTAMILWPTIIVFAAY